MLTLGLKSGTCLKDRRKTGKYQTVVDGAKSLKDTTTVIYRNENDRQNANPNFLNI